jgi:protein CpxP
MQNMKPMRTSMAAALLAACCAAAYAGDQGPQNDPGMRDPGMHGPGMPGPEGRGPEGHGPGFGHFSRELQLSEAQQDKLFAIEHAAAPQRRQQEKAIRQAHEALHALRDAAQFDEARASAASRDLGQAVAGEALLDARLHAQRLAVLTPVQREQLRQRRPQPPQDRP